MLLRTKQDNSRAVRRRSPARMYVSDEERSVLSMRHFRDHKEPSSWKKLGGTPTLMMVIFGLLVGFVMGFDQASTHGKSHENNLNQIVMDANSGVVRYSSETTPLELLGLVRKTRLTLMQKIREEYGDYANVLMDKATLDRIFRLSEGSKSRYHRRLIQKILKKQIKPKDTVPFTWVTAGDVRASGYGNNPGHSYTSMLDDTAGDAFKAVGLNLVAKNHGVYNFPSGPALSLCMNSVYGSDIDILAWDFALADGDFQYRASLFGMRATMHPSKPLLMMLDESINERGKQYFGVEGKVGVALFDTLSLQEVVAGQLPDSAQLSHPEQLPPALRFFQCNGAIEGHYHCVDGSKHHVCNQENGGICRDNKFIEKSTCDTVKYHSDWNLGWKHHRIRGRLLGLFLIELLQDALLELDEATKAVSHMPVTERRVKLLKRYEQLDGQDQFVMSNTAVSAKILGRFADKMTDLTIPLFQREPKCILPDAIHSEEPVVASRFLRVHRRLQEEEIVVGDVAAVGNQSEAAPPPEIVPPAESVPPAETAPPAEPEHPSEVVSAEMVSAETVSAETVSAATAPPNEPVPPAESVSPAHDPLVVDETPNKEPDGAPVQINSASTNEVNLSETPPPEKPPEEAKGAEAPKVDPIVDASQGAVQINSDSTSEVTISEVPHPEAPGKPSKEDKRAEAPKIDPVVDLVVEAPKDAGGPIQINSDSANEAPPPEEPEKPPEEGKVVEAPDVEMLVDVVAVKAPKEDGGSVQINSDSKNEAPPPGEPKKSSEEETLVEAPKGDGAPIQINANSGNEAPPPEASEKPSEEAIVVGAPKVDPVVEAPEGDAVHVQIDSGSTSEATLSEAPPPEVPEKNKVTEAPKVDEVVENPKDEEGCQKLTFSEKDMLAEIDAGSDGFSVDVPSTVDSFLVACFRICTSGNCIKAMDGLDSVKIATGSIEIEVDGISVQGSREIDSCHFLEGENGVLWKTKHDKFRIRFRVKEEGGAIHLFSVLSL